MPRLNYTSKPAMAHIGEPVKSCEFALLVSQNETGEGEDKESAYKIDDLTELTTNLMGLLGIPYDRPSVSDGRDKLEDFTAEERKLYYPFAFMLACLDGNCFRTGQLNGIVENGDKLPPSPETISYYIPDAYHIIKANSGNLDEVRELIKAAAL